MTRALLLLFVPAAALFSAAASAQNTKAFDSA